MKIWVAGLYDGWSSKMMHKALTKNKIDSKIIQLSDCMIDFKSGAITWKDSDLSKLDGLVIRKLGDPTDTLTPFRTALLYQLEEKGVKLFSSAKAIDSVINRYNMTLALAKAGLPIPETIVTESTDEAIDIVEKWGKAVLKPVYTSKGRGMVLLDREGAYRLSVKHWEGKVRFPFYLQKFIPSSYDIGIAVMGNQVIGAFQRESSGDNWQTTIRTGGHYESFSPGSKLAELAIKAASLFKLDYTIVDVVPYQNSYLIYEVSAFGGFKGLCQSGTDVATRYAIYILTSYSKRKTRHAGN